MRKKEKPILKLVFKYVSSQTGLDLYVSCGEGINIVNLEPDRLKEPKFSSDDVDIRNLDIQVIKWPLEIQLRYDYFNYLLINYETYLRDKEHNAYFLIGYNAQDHLSELRYAISRLPLKPKDLSEQIIRDLNL